MKTKKKNHHQEDHSNPKKDPSLSCIFCGKEEGIPFKECLVCEECLDYIKKTEF